MIKKQKPKLKRLPGRRPRPLSKADVEVIYRPFGSDGFVAEEADCDKDVFSVPLDEKGEVGILDVLIDFTFDAEIVIRPIRRPLEDVEGIVEDAARLANQKKPRRRRR